MKANTGGIVENLIHHKIQTCQFVDFFLYNFSVFFFNLMTMKTMLATDGAVLLRAEVKTFNV